MNNTHIYRALLAVLLLCGSARAQMGANLCSPSSATDTAKQSGSWQDASTWTDGTVPAVGERVYIPAGITVTNHATTQDVLWIHVAGFLLCCDHCDTQINVHTIYVPMGGALKLHSTAKCVGEFLPGPFLPGDTTQLSRGLICHGEFMAKGVEKTAWGPVLADLPVGATSLQVQSSGWAVGDKLLIAGTESLVGETIVKYQSEFVTVTGVSGDTVQFTPALKYRHFRWKPDLPFHVANLTRNIVFRSRDTASRAHAMFMGNMMCDARYVAFENMGRTDGSRVVTDPRFDTYGDFVPGSDDNVRARYADHYHRRGQLSQPVIRIGCVADGSPKWGFLIHDSVAHLKDCIAVRCYGSGFATEEGQERGSITHCLSAMNHGMGDVVQSTDEDHGREHAGDWGIDGSGFWLQGGLVDVTDCVAFDNSGRGFALFNRPLNGWPRRFYGLPDYLSFPIEVNGTLLPIDYDGVAKVASGAVPQRVFARNTAHGNKLGVQSWSSLPDDGSGNTIWPLSVRGSITDLTLWGRGCALHLEYTRQMNVDGVRIVASGAIRRWGHSLLPSRPINMRGHHVTLKRLSIEGFTKDYTYPAPVPIESTGDNGVNPNHIVESDYPVQAFGYTRN